MSRTSCLLLTLLLLATVTLITASETTTIQPRAQPGDAGSAGVGIIAVIFQILLWCCLSSLIFLPCLIFLCLLCTFCVVTFIEVFVYVFIYSKAAQKNGGLNSKKSTDFVEPIFSASPFVFGILEFFLPGCGYFALGQLHKGFIALGVTVLIICLMLICCYVPYVGYILNVLLIIVLLITSIIGVVDVYGLACKCIQDGQPITAREAYVSFLDGTKQSSGNYSNLDRRGPHFSPYGVGHQYPGGYPSGGYPNAGYPNTGMPPNMQAHMGQYPQPGYVPPSPAMMQNVQQQSTESETKYSKFDDQQ